MTNKKINKYIEILLIILPSTNPATESKFVIQTKSLINNGSSLINSLIEFTIEINKKTNTIIKVAGINRLTNKYINKNIKVNINI